MNKMNLAANNLIDLAKRHIGNGAVMTSSAQLCLDDARSLLVAGDNLRAASRALDSLRYSIGVLHDDWTVGMRIMESGRGS